MHSGRPYLLLCLWRVLETDVGGQRGPRRVPARAGLVGALKLALELLWNARKSCLRMVSLECGRGRRAEYTCGAHRLVRWGARADERTSERASMCGKRVYLEGAADAGLLGLGARGPALEEGHLLADHAVGPVLEHGRLLDELHGVGLHSAKWPVRDDAPGRERVRVRHGADGERRPRGGHCSRGRHGDGNGGHPPRPGSLGNSVPGRHCDVRDSVRVVRAHRRRHLCRNGRHSRGLHGERLGEAMTLLMGFQLRGRISAANPT